MDIPYLLPYPRHQSQQQICFEFFVISSTFTDDKPDSLRRVNSKEYFEKTVEIGSHVQKGAKFHHINFAKQPYSQRTSRWCLSPGEHILSERKAQKILNPGSKLWLHWEVLGKSNLAGERIKFQLARQHWTMKTPRKQLLRSQEAVSGWKAYVRGKWPHQCLIKLMGQVIRGWVEFLMVFLWDKTDLETVLLGMTHLGHFGYLEVSMLC